MAFLTAKKIHNGLGWLPEGTIIETDAHGKIVALHDKTSEIKDVAAYDGILCPGFVNAHCHLELSHMKGVIPEHIGLIPFLQNVTFHRNDFTEEQKVIARHNAYAELLSNGVVAVGDIANTTDTLDLRALDKLHIHSFIESIGFTNEFARQRFDFSLNTYNSFKEQPTRESLLRQSIIPHAPYSVSSVLFQLINENDPQSLISIHNQESEAEDQYYRTKQGDVNTLLKGFNIDDNFFKPSGRSSLQTYTDHFSVSHPIIYVHNTFTAAADIDYAIANGRNTSWCLCPNANLYIENRLPDVPMFVEKGINICVGTDSLASNHSLSVLAELTTLHNHFPQLTWELLLRWGTANGAKALQMDNRVGIIAPDMCPGILHIAGLEEQPDSAVVTRII
jgi:aminodeoxyfutalosine deaminase